MMFAVIFIALAAIIYRVRRRLFSRTEAAVLAVFLVTLAFVWMQIALCDHKAFPEKRYWIQSAILLSGWAVWGVRELANHKSKALAICGRHLLPVAVACLAIVAVAQLVKPYIPGTRRNAYIAAANWAAEKIREDWSGPSRDESVDFSIVEYRHPARPIVRCHTARLACLLDGRKDPTVHRAGDPLPDYVCDEEKKIDFGAKPLCAAKFELIDRLQVGKRRFALYRRSREEVTK